MASRIKCFIALMLLLLSSSLMASSPKAGYISAAGHDELLSMAELRGIDAAGLDDEAVRALLMTYEGLAEGETVSEGEPDGEEYSMQILSSDTVKLLPNSCVMLNGGVSVSFSLADGRSEKILSAESMLVNPEVGMVSAYGSVRYEDKEKDSGLGEISADVVTYVYSSGDLIVSGGTTYSERTNNEDAKITFSTGASLLNYRAADGGIFFSEGSITTGTSSLSSIKADEIAILDGGDMFLSGAFLSIGRVPVMYLPFFFYPGSRLSLNPAFGFSSSRGLFVSATLELFGKYPSFSESGEESSFASLLRTGDGEDLVSNGLYYDTPGEDQGALAKWAASSGSHMTLLLDAYADSGLHAGIDTLIKAGKFRFSTISGISLTPLEKTLYGEKFRYYSVNDLSLSLTDISLKASFPLYSDPGALSEYSGRLTSYSIDSFFGSEQKFPTGKSTVNDYEATLDASLSLPSSLKPFFIDSARISTLQARAKYTYSSQEKKYIISDVILPRLTGSLSGTIFSLSGSEAESGEEAERKTPAFSDYFILSDPLLAPMYETKAGSTSQSRKYDIYLKYTLSEDLTNSYDWSVQKNTVENGEFTSKLTGKLTFAASLTDVISLTQSISPDWSNTFREEGDGAGKNVFSARSDTTVKLPFLGLTYNFNTYVYRMESSFTNGTSESEETWYSFDRENVKAHSLSLSKTFKTSIGDFSPSLKYTLPPLTGSLTAGLSHKAGAFSLSFTEEWKEKDGEYRVESIKLSTGYLGKYYTHSLAADYDCTSFDPSDLLLPLSLTASVSVRSADKKYSLTEYVKYDYESGGKYHNFNALTTTLVTPYVGAVYSGTATDGKYAPDYAELTCSISTGKLYAWKNRIVTDFYAKGKLHYAFDNIYGTSLSIKLGLSFTIREFLALNFELVTNNNSFYRCYENDVFSFPLLWQELKNSFDFFGNGRYNTGFTMDSVSVELVHYMSDWDFYCKYSASIVSSRQGYEWVPTVSFYLKWKTIPDLKVDENYRKTSDGKWQTTTSVYGKK